MKTQRRSLKLAMVAVAALFALAATPSTKPSTRPVMKLDAHNSVEVASKPVGATFRVPRTWTQLKNESGDPALLFIYDTTTLASGKPARTNSIGVPKQFHIFLGQPCKHGATVNDVAETARAELQKMIKDVKFLRDEATTVGDDPAWSLAWNEKVNQHIVETRNGQSTPRDRQIEITREKVLWIKNGKLCDIGTLSDPSSLPAMEKFIDQIGQSFSWEAVN